MKYLNQEIENELKKKEDNMNYRDKAIHCVKDTILPMQKSNLKNVAVVWTNSINDTEIQNGYPQRQLKKDTFMKLVTLRVSVRTWRAEM